MPALADRKLKSGAEFTALERRFVRAYSINLSASCFQMFKASYERYPHLLPFDWKLNVLCSYIFQKQMGFYSYCLLHIFAYKENNVKVVKFSYIHR